MNLSRILRSLGIVCFLIVALILVGVDLDRAQVQTKVMGKQDKPPKIPKPPAGNCDGDGICESGEYDYSKSHEAQPCEDCRETYSDLVINQDGAPQIIGANSNIGKVFQFKGIDGQIQDTWATPELPGDLYPEMGDIDGDGFKELLVVAQQSYKEGKGKKVNYYYDQKIYVFKEPGNLIYESPASFGYSSHDIWLGDVIVADVDSCGRDELIINKGWQVEIYKNVEAAGNTPNFVRKWFFEADLNTYWVIYGLCVGDVDNDLKNELIMATVDDGYAYVFDFIGEDESGMFQFTGPIITESMTLGNLKYIDRVRVVDVDLDGQNEIIACGNSGTLMVWKYDGNGGYAKAFQSNPLGGYTEEIDAGDLDGDGVIEVAIWVMQTQKIHIYECTGPSSFVVEDWSPLSPGQHIKELCIGDIDFDGSDELVFGGEDNGLWVYGFDSGQFIEKYQSVYGSAWGPRIK